MKKEVLFLSVFLFLVCMVGNVLAERYIYEELGIQEFNTTNEACFKLKTELKNGVSFEIGEGSGLGLCWLLCVLFIG